MTMKNTAIFTFAAFSVTQALCLPAFADEAADLAKKLANPVAALISVPIQANYDENIGANEQGSVWRINIQPVIPVSISDDWNLISRTIVPIIQQSDIPVAGSGESGIGDVTQSFFLSPKEPTASGLIWGVGPVLLLDTASDAALGSEKWGTGPTGVVLKQDGAWTYGVLANHVVSFTGEDSRSDINATYVNPFVSFITQSKTTYGFNIEYTYDWEAEEPITLVNLTANQLFKVGDQLLQVGGGFRYWTASPDNGPKDLGFRLQLTLLFPK
jgi:hypothetical protein